MCRLPESQRIVYELPNPIRQIYIDKLTSYYVFNVLHGYPYDGLYINTLLPFDTRAGVLESQREWFGHRIRPHKVQPFDYYYSQQGTSYYQASSRW